MARKRWKFERPEDREFTHEEPWLVSYADMMTLLFGFFVLMYAFASKDKSDQWEKVRRDVAKYFGGEYITPYDQLSKDIENAVAETVISRELETIPTPEGIEITFRSAILFDSGQAYLLPGAAAPMKALAEVILARKNEVGMVIEGHTDDSPIASDRFPSNWDLSAARAATVLRLFEKVGFPRSRMHVMAYADTRPLFPNRDENGNIVPENQARNRRVVIRLFSTLTKPQEKTAAR